VSREHILFNIYNMEKKKISITISKELLDKLEEITTNKSRLIEYILLDYLVKSGYKISDII